MASLLTAQHTVIKSLTHDRNIPFQQTCQKILKTKLAFG